MFFTPRNKEIRLEIITEQQTDCTLEPGYSSKLSVSFSVFFFILPQMGKNKAHFHVFSYASCVIVELPCCRCVGVEQQYCKDRPSTCTNQHQSFRVLIPRVLAGTQVIFSFAHSRCCQALVIMWPLSASSTPDTGEYLLVFRFNFRYWQHSSHFLLRVL